MNSPRLRVPSEATSSATSSSSQSQAIISDFTSRIIFCTIIAAYVAFAAVWVVRAPPFTPPDEMAHADYMFAFIDAGKFYRVESQSTANDVLSQTQYLDRISGYRKLHYNPYARVSSGDSLFENAILLDRNAPVPSGRVPAPGSTMPYVMVVYPATYYLIVSGIVRLATIGEPRSAVAAFYVARSVNVLFGIGTLILVFPTLRRFGLSVPVSLVGAAGIAMLPLFCWVSAYIQPDNLVVLLITLAFFAAGGRHRSITLLSFAVCALILVKPHYGAALWLPAACYALSLKRTIEPVTVLRLVVLPMLSFILAVHLTPVTGGLTDVSGTASSSAAIRTSELATIWQCLTSVVASVYVGGLVFVNYWLGYGTHGFYLPLTKAFGLSHIFLALTLPAIFGCMVIYAKRIYRIARIGMQRNVQTSLRLLARGLTINVYITFTALLLTASVLGEAPLKLEARYWLTLLIPTTLIVLLELPKLLERRFRKRASFILATIILLMTLPVNMLSPYAVERDFYRPTAERPRFDGGALELNDDGRFASGSSPVYHVRIGKAVFVRGFAIDLASGLPNDRVTIISDGRPIIQATRITIEAEPIAEWHDRVLEQSGFAATVPAAKFGIGKHRVGALVWRHGSVELPLEHVVELIVTS